MNFFVEVWADSSLVEANEFLSSLCEESSDTLQPETISYLLISHVLSFREVMPAESYAYEGIDSE